MSLIEVRRFPNVQSLNLGGVKLLECPMKMRRTCRSWRTGKDLFIDFYKKREEVVGN